MVPKTYREYRDLKDNGKDPIPGVNLIERGTTLVSNVDGEAWKIERIFIIAGSEHDGPRIDVTSLMTGQKAVWGLKYMSNALKNNWYSVEGW